jgi:hypothetical protein
MISALRRIAVACLLSGFPMTAVAADGPPRLDVNASCSAAAQFAIMAGRDKEACISDERSAGSILAQNWPKYPAADKEECVETVKTGGPQSYVELLSCLEAMQGARELREGRSLAPSERPDK